MVVGTHLMSNKGITMEIVKEFKDDDYAERHNCRNWYWGLGSDGNIYRRLSDQDDWVDVNVLPIRIDLRDMKKLVREFGHLLPFLL